MDYSIIFSSMTGNTAALAEKLRDLLPTEGCLYFGEPSEEALAAPLLFVGFWTDKGTCDGKIRPFLTQLEKKTVAMFGTAGFGSDPEYFDRVLKEAESLIPVSNTILPGFMCQGKMKPTVRERYEQMLAANPQDERAKMFIENFDRALSHPDEADFETLAEWAKHFHLSE